MFCLANSNQLLWISCFGSCICVHCQTVDQIYSLVGEAALLEQPTERETIPIKSLVLYGMLIVYSTHARQVQVLEDSYKLLRWYEWRHLIIVELVCLRILVKGMSMTTSRRWSGWTCTLKRCEIHWDTVKIDLWRFLRFPIHAFEYNEHFALTDPQV